MQLYNVYSRCMCVLCDLDWRDVLEDEHQKVFTACVSNSVCKQEPQSEANSPYDYVEIGYLSSKL